MSKYTKGKWGYEYSPANDAYEIAPIKDVGLDWENEICITADNNEEEAKLISAAPEMLEMLKEIIVINEDRRYDEIDRDMAIFEVIENKIKPLITEIEGNKE